MTLTATLSPRTMIEVPTLEGREIHVWRVPLNSVDVWANDLREFLSRDERARADRYRTVELQRSFVVRRASLRILLGQYGNCDPKTLVFEYEGNDKPRLAAAGDDLRFNVSHSSEWALLAFARQCDIGVDVERVRAMRDMDAVANRFFAVDEIDRLRMLAGSEREAGFFRAWTRKEAFLKATGRGLPGGLDSFAVTLLPDEQPRLLYVRNDRDAAASWRLHDIEMTPGYLAALVYANEPHLVRTFTLANKL